MSMKAGDKVYCIKDRIFDDDYKVLSGNYYIIDSVGIPYYYSIVVYVGEHKYMQFSIIYLKNQMLFDEYFITLKEYRKLKLKRVSEKSI